VAAWATCSARPCSAEATWVVAWEGGDEVETAWEGGAEAAWEEGDEVA
jgi:hypothetical protein